MKMKQKTTASARVKSERHESDTKSSLFDKEPSKTPSRVAPSQSRSGSRPESSQSSAKMGVTSGAASHTVDRASVSRASERDRYSSARRDDRRLLSEVAKNLRVVVTVVLLRVSVRNRFVLGEWRRSVPMK